MRKILVAGNWKMHGSAPMIEELVAGIKNQATSATVDCAVFPPFVYLASVCQAFSGSIVRVGAQTVSEHSHGAYTGEVAVSMVKEAGCQYTLVGHSERRAIYGESDEQVADKFVAAQAGGLIPVLCVGETLEEREAGDTQTVVSRQIAAVAARVDAAGWENSVIAYEPVWAIGTGKTASPDQAQDVHSTIRQQMAAIDAEMAQKLRILYGGSVKPGNARELFSMQDIDGGLIGGASLTVDDFMGIYAAANQD